MKPSLKKNPWLYPIIFGLLGAFLGLVTRYLFINTNVDFPIKNIIHSHSHVMLLGFLFNALIVLIWENFTVGFDRLSYKIYLVLQVCIGAMLIAFIVQGYALFSIIFLTLHLWLSYIFVVRLWKRLQGNKELLLLIKIGIIFHFMSSIGPYCLGPLMVFEMNESPWYQQAIFFYLHFQFFGVLFFWLLALFLKKASVQITKKLILIISIAIIGLFAHSVNFSFNHWFINIVGGLSSILMVVFFLSFLKEIKHQQTAIKIIYYTLAIIALCNVLGSISFFVTLLKSNHFILIAWLHFLFLGLYVPFIWMQSSMKVGYGLWIFYYVSLICSELLLIFPEEAFQLFNISIMRLLFFAYFTVFLCFGIVHLRYFLFKSLL